MREAFAMALFGIGVIILWTVTEPWEMTLPVLIGALLVTVVLVALFWLRFVVPAIDPMVGGH